jgi:MFS family permease
VANFLADLSPLRKHRDFRRLWIGQSVSNIGGQLTVVAVSYQTYLITHSTLMVGLIGLVQLGPQLFGSLLGGSIADAVDRRLVVICGQIALAATSTGLALNTVIGRPSIALLFVCVGAAAGFQGINNPARSAIISGIVPKEDLASASALSGITQQAGLILGPSLAGILIPFVGLKSLYMIDAVSFGAVLIAAFMLPKLGPVEGGTPFGIRSVREGLQYAGRNRFLISLISLDLSSMIFGMPKAVFPALATTVYHRGPGIVGLLYAAPGIGAMVLSLSSGWIRNVRYRGRAVVYCMVVWGAAIAVLGFVPVLAVGVLMLAAAGGADMVGTILRSTIFQTTVPQRLRGRLNGVFFGTAVAGNSLGATEAGVASSIGGSLFAVWSGGVLTLVGVAVALWRYPELWRSTGYDVVDYDEDGVVMSDAAGGTGAAVN